MNMKKLKRIFSFAVATAMVFTSVGMFGKKDVYAMDYRSLDQITYTIDDSKLVLPSAGDAYDYGTLEEIQMMDNANSAVTFTTFPKIEVIGEDQFVKDATYYKLYMAKEDCSDLDEDSTTWVEGRKVVLEMAWKLRTKTDGDYSLAETNFEEAGSHPLFDEIYQEDEVAFVYAVVGEVKKGQPTPPVDPLATFTYDASKEASNFLTAGLVNSKEELFNATLTDDEQAQVKAGVNASLWLESKDISSSVSSDDKALVEKALPAGFKTSKYADLNLYKQVGNEAAAKISKCPGGKVKVALDIPSDIKDKNYKIIRLHDGKAEAIEVAEANGKITFETDKFSTYAVVYSDKAATSTPTQVGGAKTGDSTFVFVIALVAMMAVVVVIYNRKRA